MKDVLFTDWRKTFLKQWRVNIMTRINEIMEEAEKHMYDWGVDVDRFDVPDIFVEGAKWADKTMLERMLNYLEAEHPAFFNNFGEEIKFAMEE